MIQAFLDLKALHQVFDSASGVLEQQIGTPVCIPKCGRCCIVNTPMTSVIEGVNMVSFLAGMGKLAKALQEAEGWLLDGDGFTVYEGVPVGLKLGPIVEDWKKAAKSQCPFLLANLECGIHNVRPLPCRAFGVFRDGADICPRPLGKGETYIRKAIIDSQLVRPLVKDFFSRCNARQPVWSVRSFVPTVLFRAAKPKEFGEYILNRKIPSAKLFGVSVDTSLMWQPQLDQLRAGKTPEEVLQV